MVNTAFALKFTPPCKLAGKCGIYHLCFQFPPSLHFFASYLHRVICVNPIFRAVYFIATEENTKIEREKASKLELYFLLELLSLLLRFFSLAISLTFLSFSRECFRDHEKTVECLFLPPRVLELFF